MVVVKFQGDAEDDDEGCRGARRGRVSEGDVWEERNESGMQDERVESVESSEYDGEIENRIDGQQSKREQTK